MILDRTTQPPFILPKSIHLPGTVYSEPGNGIRFWSINTGTQPVVRLSLVFRAGTRYQNNPFAASAMLNMMSEGTERYSAAEIAELFDFYGIYYDTSIDRDYAMVTVNCLGRFLTKTLEILEEILLRPVFDPNELSIYASKRRQQLIIEREKPSYQARELFSQALFGKEHPYGIVSPADAYEQLTPEILRTFYDDYYTAGNLFAVASGRISPEVRDELSGFLSKIRNGAFPATDAIPPVHSQNTIREKRDGALQSSLRIGKVLFPKGHPDFNGMQVLATVLGGYFGSRLVTNIREDKGYTYGIYSAMITMQHTGYFAIASDVAAEVTDDAVREIFHEVERLRSEPVPAQELDMVRNIIAGEMMRILDGPFGVADVMIEQVQSELPEDAVNQFLQEVRGITPERLQELAVKYLDPATFTSVIVGA